MTQEQTLTQPTAQATPAGDGSLDAAVQALQNMHAAVPGSEQEEEATQEDAQEADPDTEATEGETEEDTGDTEAELGEVEFEGLKFSVPVEHAETLQKALLRQADYSRKMNEVSVKEKAYTQKLEEAERYAEGAQKHAETMATARLIDERLKAFDRVDWQSLRGANPAEYAAMAADVQSLRLAKAQAEQQAASVGQEVEQARLSALSEKRAAMHQALTRDLKGWGDEMGTQLTKYASENGVALESLQTLTDPGMVKALHKAKLYDDLQKAKIGAQAKLKAVPPVLRPGSVRPTNKHAEAMSRLSKTGGDEDAIAALASMRRS